MLQNKLVEAVQEDCMVCPLAKQCRLKFPSSVTHTTKMFQLVHLDVWGPYRDPTYDRKYYFLIVVDDFSRFTWISLLQTKKDVIVVLRSFISMVCNQFDCAIKVLRFDNSVELFNNQVNELLSSLGIIHQSRCPYISQQNGIIERKHSHILDTSRALKMQSHIPSRFWGECVQIAVYLINRLPTTVLNGQSPYIRLFGKAPKLEHIRVFGSLCFATVLPRSEKFE
ncbi:hypothetical protein AABB24_037309, partial [Solanum stoloniferum]